MSICPKCGASVSMYDAGGNPWYACGSTKTFRSGSCVDREPVWTQLLEAQQRIKRLEEAEQWIPASTKPEGCERKVLLWIVWPNVREWCDSPEPLIGWWKHGPQCFALGDIENADHLVRYWMEIADPTEAKEAKP